MEKRREKFFGNVKKVKKNLKNFLKRYKNVHHLSVYKHKLNNVTFCILNYCLCSLYYNFTMLLCQSISNNVANDAKYH